MADDKSRGTDVTNPTQNGQDSAKDEQINELLEKIRQLEDENEHLKEENNRIGRENTIFKKVLRAIGIDPDNLLTGNEEQCILEYTKKTNEVNLRLKMNSRNSSKPPSSDGYAKPPPKSRRVRTGRKQGGQIGHIGHHMEIPHEPDRIMFHLPSGCEGCAHATECIKKGLLEHTESRYEVKAVIRTEVVEHRAMQSKGCPFGHPVEDGDEGDFPKDIRAWVQYDNAFTMVCGLLSTYGAMSISRISTILQGLFGVTLSTGTVQNLVNRCAAKVRSVLKDIKNFIINSVVAHFDETGIRINGKLMWVHNSSTNMFTYLTLSEKRGFIGMIENGVLPYFKGIAIHDCWSPYWRFGDIMHATCGAHFLRELDAITEMEPGHTWASQFIDLLMRMKTAKDLLMSEGYDCFSEDLVDYFDKEYDRIMSVADKECPPPPKPMVKHPGPVAKGKERALIERLIERKESVYMYMKDFRVPFDNNQAERDLRNVKTKMKVSGCFRTMEGARGYLDVMSYISTGRKHGVDAYSAIKAAFEGHPEIVFQPS